MKNSTAKFVLNPFVIARPFYQGRGNLVALITARRDCFAAQSPHVPSAMTNVRLSISIFMFLAIFCLSSVSCNHPDKKSAQNITSAQKTSGRPMEAIEIIVPKDSAFNAGKLNGLCKKYNVEPQNVQRWKNRIIILANEASLSNGEFSYWLLHAYPKDSIVLFNKPFYNFNRSMCSDTVSSKDWDNIVLTANLVKDPKMQQEYLNYHQTQFQKWPEVSKGFCNANFQQLLVFKQGRQLVLVISIPKGESLDHLNPLTTKNNPRVDDWNKIMNKYQEGVEGTKKGETWVFAKSIPHE